MSEALARLIKAASVVDVEVLSEFSEPHPWESELAMDELALAARDYVREIEASDTKPVGWNS